MPLAEQEETLANESDVVPKPGRPVPIYFYHPDHLGTSTALTDFNGKAYQFFLNLPFGETMAEQLGSNYYNTPYKFNGKELDEETGLYYYGARYYDPRVSIWYSVDPLAEQTPNVNPYVYCNQNPIKYIDPTGMSTEDPGDPIEPSPAGLLYEMYLHADAAVFNFMAKSVEAVGYGKPGINIRKETQIDDYAGMRNVIVHKPEGTWGHAVKETLLDALSLVPATTFSKAGMSAAPGLLAKIPWKTAIISFTKKGFGKVEVLLPEGYKLTKLKSQGQKVYSDGKNFISPDQTSHKGGIWKMYDNAKKVGGKDRMGTYNAELKKIAK